MNLQVADLVYPVTALGYGRRFGIWVQGCSISCEGCMSRDTWDSSAGTPMQVEEVLDVLHRIEDLVDGITVSGGEPFQQADAVEELMAALHAWRKGLGPGTDFLAFSGYSETHLRRTHPELVGMFDLVIAGPFRKARPSQRPLCGSDNQVVMEITSLGSERYQSLDRQRRIQVSVSDGSLHLIGIPGSGDLVRLETALEQKQGVFLEDASWRT